MPDEEFDKILTIGMANEEANWVKKYGCVFYAMRNGLGIEKYEDAAVYSFGGMPFKIKILD